MTQEKNILNDGVDCFAANLHKVRLKNEHKAETRSHDKVLDPLVSCLAIVFLAMFIFVFLFLLITFWNVGPVVSVDTEGKGTTAGEPAAALASASASSAGGARAIISYLTARRSNPVSQLKSLLGKSDRLTPPSGQTD